MLTPLQERIWRLVDSLPDAGAVALVGGGALIVHGVVDRATTDLDFFSDDIADIRRAYLPAQAEIGQVLALEDLAGDKIAALFSRAEARDFVDVYALSARFSRAEMYALARDKDTGFVLDRLHDSLGAFEHRHRQDFPVSDAEYERLRAWVQQWQAELPTPETGTPGHGIEL